MSRGCAAKLQDRSNRACLELGALAFPRSYAPAWEHKPVRSASVRQAGAERTQKHSDGDRWPSAWRTTPGCVCGWTSTLRPEDYLVAYRLYVECLDAADASGCEGLRDRLLRAPVSRQGE
jgi:hypothetical protein